MGGNDKFPWESLKADCLRIVCSQLAEGSSVSTRVLGKKEDMIEFLRDVNDQGVETALENIEQNHTARASNHRTPQSSPSKRRNSHLSDDEDAGGDSDNDEGYNTRYKGVKRVKVTEYTPEPDRAYDPKPKAPRKTSSPRKSEQTSYRGRGRPRKSDAPVGNAPVHARGPTVSRGRGRPRKSDVDNRRPSKVGAGDDKPKRGRGRPRKSENAHPAGEGTKPESQGKQVFVGVVLQTRTTRSHRYSEGGAMDADPKNQEHDDDGEEEDDAVLRVNGNLSGDLSSLGSSNKENQPIENGVEIGDADADGDIDADISVEL